MTHEPTRLLLDPVAGAALRRDLGAVAHVEAGYDVAAGLARFEGNLARGAGAAKAGLGAKLAGAALLLGGGLAAALLLTAPDPAPFEAPPPAATGLAVAPQVVPPPAPVVPVVAPQVVTPEPDEEPEILADEPVVDPPPRTTRRPVRAARPAAEPAAEPADYLREARNLQAARGLLGRDAARALELAEAGAAEFRGGTFAQEWEGVAILALFELGRPEARARGEAYLRTYPSGTYAPRVRQALEN